MERVLANVPWSCSVIYLDDLLIHTVDFEGAMANLMTSSTATPFVGLVYACTRRSVMSSSPRCLFWAMSLVQRWCPPTERGLH